MKETRECLEDEIREELMKKIHNDLKLLSVEQLFMISGFIKSSLKTTPNREAT